MGDQEVDGVAKSAEEGQDTQGKTDDAEEKNSGFAKSAQESVPILPSFKVGQVAGNPFIVKSLIVNGIADA